jgi:ferredoxin--NADP+ reductase
MDALGTAPNPLRVAVVGSGPSGFYAAEALLKSGREVRVDMIERLPAPYGLVRYGVAPDHPKLKEPILVYSAIARLPHFSLLGNVTVGRDVSVDELRAHYHAVVFTCGAQTDRRLGIPGEDLPGSHTATEFVAWYNGHPDYRDHRFDLAQEAVAIVGQGNVAADLGRILAKSVDELRTTDIARHALDALAASRVKEIHVIGRRGPAQAKFTNKELKELGELANCDAIVAPQDLELNPASRAELEAKANFVAAKNVEILRQFALQPRPASRAVSSFISCRVRSRSRAMAALNRWTWRAIDSKASRSSRWPRKHARPSCSSAGCSSAASAIPACRCRGSRSTHAAACSRPRTGGSSNRIEAYGLIRSR